ncbi:MAG: signal peptidase II [Alphaproteobacteria bacterium]
MLRFALMVGGVLAADQALKYYVLYTLGLMEVKVIEVTSFFNLALAWNTGISFSLLDGGEETRWLLTAGMAAITLVLIVWYFRTTDALPRLALPVVVGGALGNIADRVQYGAVVDFLDFHYAGYHWYTFNIADTAIVGGALLLLLDSFRGTSGQETE